MDSIEISKFKSFIEEISIKYKQMQIKASISVNQELLNFYFYLGKQIHSFISNKNYGSEFYEKLSKELINNFPNTHGFSPRNLRYIEKFYVLYSDINLPQLVANLMSIPWGHHRCIIDKCKNLDEALFFVYKIHENNWSRSVLLNFLDTDLYKREGKAITNFDKSLEIPKNELAQSVTKDPYIFDFLSISDDYKEKELKDALIDNIQKFLLELGTGFAYIGREFKLDVAGTELFSDLLFYNTKLHAYVVIEVKTTEFKPEHLGQLNGYVATVNHLLKTNEDNPTIGLLICKSKNDVLAKYCLENYNIPLGISEFELNNLIPKAFKSSLPTIEELENELSDK